MENLKEILAFCKGRFYFGEGSPDAKILFVGKEIGYGHEKDKHPDVSTITKKAKDKIDENLNNWNLHIEHGVGNYLKNMGNLFREKTNPTWISYQKILNEIEGREQKADKFDFLSYCFITEFSQIPLPNSGHKSNDKEFAKEKKQNINKRKELLEQSFFQKIPIVIMACGNYIKRSDIETIFGVKLKEGKKELSKGNWYSLYKGKTNKGEKKILIHTRQLSNGVSDKLLSEIAKKCE